MLFPKGAWLIVGRGGKSLRSFYFVVLREEGDVGEEGGESFFQVFSLFLRQLDFAGNIYSVGGNEASCKTTGDKIK